MMRIWRLLYYARRYWLQALSAVVFAAGVGLLDAFRVLLIGPIFDNVLHPAPRSAAPNKSPAARRNRCALAHQHHPPEPGPAAPPQRLGRDRLRVRRLHAAQGHLRLHRHLSRQLRRLRHDHRHARRPLRGDPAPLRLLLPESTPPARCSPPSSTTSSACST